MARTLGSEIRKVRQLRGLSLNAVAKPAGLSATYVQKLERGEVESPSPHRLQRLAEALGLDYADLFRLAGYPLPAAGEAEGSAETDLRHIDIDSADASLVRKAFQSPEFVSDEELEQLGRYLAFLREQQHDRTPETG